MRLLVLGILMAIMSMAVSQRNASAQTDDVDWPKFMERSDMLWESLPTSWDTGPFLGNGNLGTIFWQDASGALRFEVSRTDLYDHRRMGDTYTVLFSRYRLPNGHFKLSFDEGKPAGEMRLDLWNAESRGEIRLADGTALKIRCFALATDDVIVLEIARSAGDPGAAMPALTWHPDPAKSTRGRSVPPDLKAYPEHVQRQIGETLVSVQEMPEAKEYRTDGMGVGQYATAWTAATSSGLVTYFISTRFTYPGANAADEAVHLVEQAKKAGIKQLESVHRRWWHEFYPKSLISVPDAAIESFYWAQMYKMASGSREGGPVLDLLGPWFAPTPWPGIWWNLNIQLTYWPYYMSNHLAEAEPLARVLWEQRGNLAENAAPHETDSYAIGRATAQDCAHPVGVEVGNLPWTMHNLWLYYRSSMDDQYLRDQLFPLMKGSFRYLRHILKTAPDGSLVLPQTASPEYTDAVESCSYTLANIRWLAATIIRADERLKSNDPIVSECREVLQKLEPYRTDEATGFLVGKDMPLAQSHRHWSHLFMIYPFYEYSFDQPEHAALLEKSLENWTSKPGAFAGYSWLGAASMHAAAGRRDRAREYLQTFLRKSPAPNTLYREWGPCIETPLAFARSLQEMLLTSHGDLIRVFPAVPADWQDVTFSDLRTEGAFLVSARREGGVTRYLRVTSLAGEPCRIRTGLSGDVKAISKHRVEVRDAGNGISEIQVAKGQSVVLYSGERPGEFVFNPVDLDTHQRWGGAVPK